MDPAPTTVRDLIPEVVAEYGIPIGSCPDGYYRIVSDEGVQRELDRRRGTIETKREKMRALARAYYGGGVDG